MDPVPAAPDGATLGPLTDPALVPELPEPGSEAPATVSEPLAPVLEPADDHYFPI